MSQELTGLGLNFRLRTYNELDQKLVQSKSSNPWKKILCFTPEGLEHEKDQDFLDRLGMFAREFQVGREQAPQLWDQLRKRLGTGHFEV